MRTLNSNTECSTGRCSRVWPGMRITSCQVKTLIAFAALAYLMLQELGVF
jgi:hypothetical protein